ncbi:protein phosphatase 1 regulatory subunit 3A-like [Centroberyx affinis]|uniref:protein phosphatase 1 regulatory subunit 3A-like n=1 Tax=Centroberyx affinis TaxID=166261 RepID=UPI003A5C1A54
MSFLSIPSQEGLFTTIKTGKSAEEGECKSPLDDDDEDDDTEDVRLIPRCSPVPRKRGQSIFDETAEYMRIHSALPAARRRVSFADTTGGDLTDVKEFVAFDSDDEEDDARWEEEQARYRKPEREPTYHVNPEFHAPTDSVLLQAVHTNKVEVELLSPVENEPLAVSGIIRVLNISFHKAVYIRSTMDNWASYFDYPAEYVQGSHDGDTDKFSFKLCFAPPYNTHGSRIEFVVRYETSDGDYWANNSHMNYVVTLLLSYEDDSAQTSTGIQDIRGILKPPKMYSMDDDYDYDYEDESDRDEEDPGPSKSQPFRPTPVGPTIIQPKIDVEIADHPSGPPVPPNQELPSVGGTLSTTPVSPGDQFPSMSSETMLHTDDEEISFILQASEPVQPNKSQPLPRLHCESGNQISEQPKDSRPSALPSASTSSLPHLPICSLDPCEYKTKSSSQTEISLVHPASFEKKTSLDDIEADPGFQKNEEGASQTDSKVKLKAIGEEVGIPDIFRPSTTNTLPTATVIPSEQSPYVSSKIKPKTIDEELFIASECSKHLETTEPSLVEAAMGSVEECESLKQEELISTDREKEQDFSIHTEKPLTASSSPSADHSDSFTSPQTEISSSYAEVSERRALMDDTDVASLESGEEVLLTRASLAISQVIEEAIPSNENTEEEEESLQVQERHTAARRKECDTEDLLTETRPGEGILRSVASSMWPPTIETNLGPTGEDGLSRSLASHPSPEPPADHESFPSVTPRSFKRGVVVRSRELAAGLSEDSSISAPHDENSPAALLSLESQVSLGAEGEAAPSPALTDNTSVITGVTEVSQNLPPNSTQARKEKQHSLQVSPDTLLLNLPNTLSKVAKPLKPQPERDLDRNLIPSIVFLSGVIFLSVELQEPSALFLVGLFFWFALFLIVAE